MEFHILTTCESEAEALELVKIFQNDDHDDAPTCYRVVQTISPVDARRWWMGYEGTRMPDWHRGYIAGKIDGYRTGRRQGWKEQQEAMTR